MNSYLKHHRFLRTSPKVELRESSSATRLRSERNPRALTKREPPSRSFEGESPAVVPLLHHPAAEVEEVAGLRRGGPREDRPAERPRRAPARVAARPVRLGL